MDSPVTVCHFIAASVFIFLTLNGTSCCLLKRVMFLFVHVGEKTEGLASPASTELHF